jgi:hypothetical protein
MAVTPQQTPDPHALWQRLVLPEEERRWIRNWEGSYRWFRSANVVPLERYRGAAEMARIREVLLAKGRAAARY